MNLKNKVVYQIYPKSFLDTDGDGIGDLKGIIQKLDYFQFLGVDYLWLTPIFVSPQKDNGYDVADYCAIEPTYGTMADVDELIFEADKRGIGIVFDMVLNHTSTEHTWFQQALAGDKRYQDYYFFKEKPTNWQSKFGGSAWSYVEAFDLYYLHLFDVTQADLNWENPEVFDSLCEIVNFWLDKGIKGLRLDVINLISKPKVFKDDNEGDGRRFYTDGPHVHEYLHALNRSTFGKREEIVVVGELSSTSLSNGVQYANPKSQELSTVFNFHHLKVDYKDGQKWQLKPYDLVEFKTIMNEWQQAMYCNNAVMSLFLNNHDQPRSVSRFGNDEHYHQRSAKMLAMTMQCLDGMPYIYQGEEIGLANAYFTDIKSYRDIESLNMYEILKQDLDDVSVLNILSHRSRDNGRTPIPWNRTNHFGFTSGTPWLDLSKHTGLITVEEAIADSTSVFYTYKDLIALRKNNAVIQDGAVTFIHLDDPTLFAYRRTLDDEEIRVYSNFDDKLREITLPKGNFSLVMSNVERSDLTSPILLKPYESLIIAKDK